MNSCFCNKKQKKKTTDTCSACLSLPFRSCQCLHFLISWCSLFYFLLLLLPNTYFVPINFHVFPVLYVTSSCANNSFNVNVLAHYQGASNSSINGFLISNQPDGDEDENDDDADIQYPPASIEDRCAIQSSISLVRSLIQLSSDANDVALQCIL